MADLIAQSSIYSSIQSIQVVPESCRNSVVLVGCGNIGSYLVPLLGWLPGITRVTLIDRDFYEEENLVSQAITPKDVGRPKARIQARRLRRINRALDVRSIEDSVENVPLGALRAGVILTGLDSRRSRQTVNQAAWRLGVPWIDAGVESDGLLVRVTTYWPGADAPCLECLWEARDYELLEQDYPCHQGQESIAPAATNAPPMLGALAASLVAFECRKLAMGDMEQSAVEREIVFDASWHKLYVTQLHRNPRCRFDHKTWSIESRQSAGLTLAGVLALAAEPAGSGPAGESGQQPDPVSLGVDGHVFVTKLTCPGCGTTRPTLRLAGRMRPRDQTCRRCGCKMVAAGADMVARLELSDLPAALRDRPLRALGLKTFDVFTVAALWGERRYEVAGPEATARSR